ncbi:hypothetical protein CP978_11640 [Streptomyces nodosus]|uniref:Uncharacterized protein n=1 Tax=Streptomyces nodosus TaxID=40318 RepID=A0A5P2W489_9ACTN|nr:hypothetical protein CP978_11640 [Streptomyces nodosus]
MRAIARRRKVLVAELPGPSGNAASVRAGRRPPGPTFVRSSEPGAHGPAPPTAGAGQGVAGREALAASSGEPYGETLASSYGGLRLVDDEGDDGSADGRPSSSDDDAMFSRVGSTPTVRLATSPRSAFPVTRISPSRSPPPRYTRSRASRPRVPRCSVYGALAYTSSA